MGKAPDFDRSVFINCPFDKDFEPIMQAMLFCVVYLGYRPRIARERSNAAEVRIEKIAELIRESRYSIHDLSRAKAVHVGEFYRLNMPFELGIDDGCRRFAGEPWLGKQFLIMADKRYSYQKALSDIAGNDIERMPGALILRSRRFAIGSSTRLAHEMLERSASSTNILIFGNGTTRNTARRAQPIKTSKTIPPKKF